MNDGKKSRLAIIPARGGSKRIPKKNSREFVNKPMIVWSIEAAKESQLFDDIIVSTDNEEIAEIAKQQGVSVPFKRPDELSDDYTGTIEVIAHAVQWAIDQGWELDAVCCIYATAPFIQVDDIIGAYKALNSGNWAYSFTVTDFPAPIFRSFKTNEQGGLEMFFPEHFTTRSQDLPEALHDAGQFYWGKPEAWLEGKRIFDSHSIPFPIPRWRVQDIDTPEDWDRALQLAKILSMQ
jgi:N-acylneuraminate cytidylyltransferase